MGANIRLESIAESAFNDFLEAILPPYIEERSAADHVSKTVAEQFAHRQNAELLPRGYHTPGHYFARIIDGVTNLAVGTTWFAWIPHLARPTSTTSRFHQSTVAGAMPALL